MSPDSIENDAPAVDASPLTMQDIYAEALSELRVGDDDAAKRLIKERLAEIKRLQTLLNKAQAELDELLRLPVEEVALIASGTKRSSESRMLKGF